MIRLFKIYIGLSLSPALFALSVLSLSWDPFRYFFLKRNKTKDDFYLGNRGLGAFVAALSASASSSSAWTLLGVSGLAYSIGLGAVWILPGVMIGYYVSWKKRAINFKLFTFICKTNTIFNNNIHFIAQIFKIS